MAGAVCACLEVDLGHGPVIAGEEGQQHLCRVAAHRVFKLAHDPEVNRDHVAPGIHQETAGAQVGVEGTVLEYLVEEGSRELLEYFVQVVACVDERLPFIDRDPRNPLERKDPPAGPFPADT